MAPSREVFSLRADVAGPVTRHAEFRTAFRKIATRTCGAVCHPEFRTAFGGKGGKNTRGPELVEGPGRTCSEQPGHWGRAGARGAARRRVSTAAGQSLRGKRGRSSPPGQSRDASRALAQGRVAATRARCSETRPFTQLRKHPERSAAAVMNLAPAVPAARSRRTLPLTDGAQASFDSAHRRLRADALRSGCLRFLCAVARTPFLPALSAEGGPELRVTRSPLVMLSAPTKPWRARASRAREASLR